MPMSAYGQYSVAITPVKDRDSNMKAEELHVCPCKLGFYETNILKLIQNYQMQYCLVLENLR